MSRASLQTSSVVRKALRSVSAVRACHKQLLAASVGATAALTLFAGSASALEKLSEFSASGFIFKDSVDVGVLDDPDVENVTVYVSEMQRSLSDRIAKNFFNEPSQASLGCVATGTPTVRDVKRVSGKEGHELFNQGKNLAFFQQKTLRVRRIFDEKRSTLVYVAYSTRLTSAQDEGGASTGRYKTSVCAIPGVQVLAPPTGAP